MDSVMGLNQKTWITVKFNLKQIRYSQQNRDIIGVLIRNNED